MNKNLVCDRPNSPAYCQLLILLRNSPKRKAQYEKRIAIKWYGTTPIRTAPIN